MSWKGTTIFFLLCLSVLPAKTVTFNGDIAGIIYANCSTCHRPGEAAPFPLLTYDDVAKHGKLIASVTKARIMPPWKAEPASYNFREERRLKPEQIALIEEWVKQGMPKGDPSKAPAVPLFPQGWQLGKPDLIVEMPREFAIPADGPDLYRNFLIPLNLPEDRWIRAIELRPSARRAVHHVLYYADSTGELRKTAGPAGDLGNSMRFRQGSVPLGGWALGSTPHFFPEGVAMRLPKGSDLVFQYHFHPSGKPESEKSVIGLYFASKPPARTLTGIQLPPVFGVFAGVDIPAGEKNFRVKDSFVLPVDVDAIGVGAHAHYIGKEMKMTAHLPTGESKTLLWIKDWDFSWQDRYYFEDFVSLPKGTRLDAEVSWDNSAENPRNPARPPVRVKWGEQSNDEMGSVSLSVLPHRQSDLAALHQANQQHIGDAIRSRFAKNPLIREMLLNRFRIPGGKAE